MAGLFNYRGAPVPVIDLSQLTLGRPAARRLSTRIVLVHYPDESGGTHLLGLIAERATQTVRHEPSDFVRVRRHQRRRAVSGPGGHRRARPAAVDRRADAAAAVAPRRVVQGTDGRSMALADFEDLLKASMGLSVGLDRLGGDRARGAGAAVGLPAATIRTPIWNASARPRPSCRR